jgi:ADP-heptose:LPS heptosyltransferase
LKRSLLVILPHNPGDVVMALAAVRQIKIGRPDLDVDYVVGEECRDLAQDHPLLRRVLVMPRKELLAAWNRQDVDGALRPLEDFLAALSAEEYAVSLNLFQERSGGLMHGLLRSRRKIGLQLADGSHYRVGSRFLEHLFAIPAERRQNGWHAVDLYVRAAREALGVDPAEKWPLPDPASPWLPPLRVPEGWDGPAPRGYLAFHPGAAWAGKRWPESHWAALADACLRAGREVVFTGAPEERTVMEGIRARMTGTIVHDYIGKTSLAGAAWIHGNARMTVTGDTAAMHLAAAAGTPTLALFGASNPVETGPYGKGHFLFQTQLELPADLPFDRPHAGLAALKPEIVSRFLLDAAPPNPPEGAALWETSWDSTRNMQVLRDIRGRLHPHQSGSAALLELLDHPSPPAFPAPSEAALSGSREAVRRALDLCLSRGESRDFAALEKTERDLGDETRDSVVWEAYRIAVNGLSVADLREHARLRRDRFAQALSEDATVRRTR